MIKEMKGWKVIRSSDYYSCGNPLNQHRVRYLEGKITKPTLKDSKLFFFAKKEDADRFVGESGLGRFVGESGLGYFFVPCIAYNCSKIKYVCEGISGLGKFWKLKKQKKSTKPIYTIPAPKGTWIAESIGICF